MFFVWLFITIACAVTAHIANSPYSYTRFFDKNSDNWCAVFIGLSVFFGIVAIVVGIDTAFGL